MRSFVAPQLNIAHNRCAVPGACALAYMMRLNASLTHLDATYNPLGEAGASNGCISVRDYDKFLQAYEDGKFDRIIVVRSVEDPLPSQLASN